MLEPLYKDDHGVRVWYTDGVMICDDTDAYGVNMGVAAEGEQMRLNPDIEIMEREREREQGVLVDFHTQIIPDPQSWRSGIFVPHNMNM